MEIFRKKFWTSANQLLSALQLIYILLIHITVSLEKQCKDDMVKEAIVEATPNKKIVLHLDEKLDSIYKCVAFKDGNMYLITSPKYFNSYISYIADFDLPKIL